LEFRHEKLRRFFISIILFIICILLSGFNLSASTLTLSNYGNDDSQTETSTFTTTATTTETLSDIFFTDTQKKTIESTSTSTETETPTPSQTLTQTQTSTLQDTSTAIFSFTPTPISMTTISGEYVTDEILVKIDSSYSLKSIINALINNEAYVTSDVQKNELLKINVLLVKVPEGTVPEKIPQFEALPGIVSAEPNYLVHMLDTIPNDPLWPSQYGLVNIRAPQGWDYSTGSSAVIIAILDTGVDQVHPEFAGKILPGYDFANGDANPQDDNGHGTHMAGIAAAIGNNNIGVAGTSWGASILPVKVLDSFGSGSYADVATGIIWAADNSADIINMSFGGSGAPSGTVLQDAVNYAYNKGCIQIASAGNTGGGFVIYPARYDHVIAVAATDSGNNRAGFSNFGPEVDLAAPGVSIISTELGGSYGNRSGTSASASFVSGLASILEGLTGSNNPDWIEYLMEISALDLGAPGYDVYYGYGLIQMDTAIILLIPSPPNTPTATYTNGGYVPPSSYLYTATLTTTATISVSAIAPTIEGQEVDTQGLVTPTRTGDITPTSTPTEEATEDSNIQFLKQNKYLIVFFVCCWYIVFVLLFLAIKRDRKKKDEDPGVSNMKGGN